MPNLVFNGSITVSFYNSASVTANPPIPDCVAPSSAYPSGVQFDTQTIIWSNPQPPASIINLTPSQLVNGLGSLFREITFTPKVVILSGSQQTDSGAQPQALLGLISGTSTSRNNQIVQAPIVNNVGYYSLNGPITVTFPNIPPSEISIFNQFFLNIWNSPGGFCPGDFGSTTQYVTEGFSLNLILDIQLTILCTGIGLENEVCSQYCSPSAGNEAAANLCLPDYLDFCFSTNPATGQDFIATNTECQDFISNYIQNINPIAQIDTALTNYCTTKYESLEALFTSNNNTDIQMCACHMQQSQYDAFEQSLFARFPGYANIGVNERCFVPQCASSAFKTVSTTKVCNVPNCINVASINNNGTFDPNSVTIIQNAGCANIVGSGGNVPNGNQENWFQKYGIWLILGIILIIIVILIIVFIAYESSSPDNNNGDNRNTDELKRLAEEQEFF